MLKHTNDILLKNSAVVILPLAISVSLSSVAQASPAAAEKPGSQKFELKATKTEANKQSAQKSTDKRKEIVSEAVSTLRETQDALKALDEGKNKEALSSLERATGKLEIVLARDPKTALVPLDVKAITSDVYGSLDAIKNARQEAEKLLKDGQVQAARTVLMNLCSETVISTTNLPMVTYPAALKKAAKLIDENKVNEAKEVLQTAMSTLVITDVVIPLPVVDAQISLRKASELAKAQNRTQEQNKQLSALLSEADNDIKFAQALGYGKRGDFDSFHKEIEGIRQKTANGKSGIGFFDQIKSYMESMTKNSQHKTTPSKHESKG